MMKSKIPNLLVTLVAAVALALGGHRKSLASRGA
jgi:hypothetical protein